MKRKRRKWRKGGTSLPMLILLRTSPLEPRQGSSSSGEASTLPYEGEAWNLEEASEGEEGEEEEEDAGDREEGEDSSCASTATSSVLIAGPGDQEGEEEVEDRESEDEEELEEKVKLRVEELSREDDGEAGGELGGEGVEMELVEEEEKAKVVMEMEEGDELERLRDWLHQHRR